MKRLCVNVSFVALTLILFCSAVNGQIATLRFSGDTATVSVNLVPSILPVSIPIAGGLYFILDDNWTQLKPLLIPAPEPADTFPPFTRFTISFPKAQYNPKATYKVILFGSFKNKDGASISPSQEVAVLFPSTLSLVKDPVTCPDGLTLLNKTELGQNYDWPAYYNWLAQFSNNQAAIATLMIRKLGTATADAYEIERFRIVTLQSTAQTTGNSRVCLQPKKALPGSTFTAELKLNPLNLPPDITGQAKAPELAGVFTVEFPKIEDITEPGKRKLERNLDLGATLVSSVADEVVPATATTPEKVVRKRNTQGVFDIRFAPWLDVLHPIIKEEKWLNFLTPLYLNANVATGDIVKETLGLNRVLIGLEGESRYYTLRRFTDKNGKPRKSNPIWHRIKWGAQHASDRDFEQREFTTKIEYAPIFEALYKPYEFNFTNNALGETVQRPYGYTFQPKIGLEVGQTYYRGSPAPAVKPSDTVRRLYFGAEASLNLTQFTTYTLADTFYVRGETPKDHFKNYFKGTFDFHIRVNNNVSNGFFLTFERGQLAPFSTPDVNTLRIGYRILGSFCGDFCR